MNHSRFFFFLDTSLIAQETTVAEADDDFKSDEGH